MRSRDVTISLSKGKGGAKGGKGGKGGGSIVPRNLEFALII
jgi:hypothetical protein